MTIENSPLGTSDSPTVADWAGVCPTLRPARKPPRTFVQMPSTINTSAGAATAPMLPSSIPIPKETKKSAAKSV